MLKTVASLKTTKSSQQHKNKLKSITADIQTATVHLSAQLESVDSALAETREADRKVAKAEKADRNAVRALFTALGGNNLLDNDEAWSDVTLISELDEESAASTHASAQIPPQLETYFEAVSTLKIMRERLLDLHEEFQEQSERRDLLTDQGQPLEQSDAEFASMQSSMLQSAEKDFSEAAVAVADARKLCAAEGVEIPSSSDSESMTDGDQYKDQHRERGNVITASSPHKSTTQHIIRGHLESSSFVDGPVLSGAASSSQSPQEIRSQAFERVSHWMERVMDGGVGHSAMNDTLPPANSTIASPFAPWPGPLRPTFPLKTRSLP